MVKLLSKFWIFGFVIFIFQTLEITSRSVSSRELDQEDPYPRMQKRPFCNAFTGCGRKRSRPDMGQLRYHQTPTQYQPKSVHEILSDFIDLDAEPAVKDVQQQIMSQAKFLEAIKEATKEIFDEDSKPKPNDYQDLAMKDDFKRRFQYRK
ncbi:CCAP family protein [Megaselia abdita]